MNIKNDTWGITLNTTVAVIIRSKNRLQLLPRAIKSVMDQSYTDWIMVIVNDGGEQEPLNYLIEQFYKNIQHKIQVIHNENSLGMEAASNVGIKSVTTKYVAMLDDDDSWTPDFLNVSINELDRMNNLYSNIMGVACFCKVVHERIEMDEIIIDRVVPLVTDNIVEFKEGLISLRKLLVNNMFSNNSFLYYYSVFENIGYYREDLPVLGDWEFNIRFIKKYDIFVIPQFLSHYHQRINNATQYGNSVTRDFSVHLFYHDILRNEWLRQDLLNESNGLGYYTNSLSMLNEMQNNQRHIMQAQSQTLSVMNILANKLLELVKLLHDEKGMPNG